MERLSERHRGQDSLVTMLMVTTETHVTNISLITFCNFQNINQLCLDPGEKEDRVLVVKVDQKMTRDDVVDDILRKMEQYFNK